MKNNLAECECSSRKGKLTLDECLDVVESKPLPVILDTSKTKQSESLTCFAALFDQAILTKYHTTRPFFQDFSLYWFFDSSAIGVYEPKLRHFTT